MSLSPHITLDQWQALAAVVDAGGYAQAAARLHKSQSAVSYLVRTLEQRLRVEVFARDGRKAVLTPTGETLYRQAHRLLELAQHAERAAHSLSAGWEPTIRLGAEVLFPPDLLVEVLRLFSTESPDTRVEVLETVLSGTVEALNTRSVDLAITPQVPVGFLGDPLLSVTLVAVAHPDHPLHRMGRTLTAEDLREHRHILVRDSGVHRDTRTQSIEVERRWTFSHFDTSIRAVVAGHGFAWYPAARISAELREGRLKPLTLEAGTKREIALHLVFANSEEAGPGTRRLATIIDEVCRTTTPVA